VGESFGGGPPSNGSPPFFWARIATAAAGLRSQAVKRIGLEGLTIKAALALGFGLTLGVWLFTGYYFAQRMSAVERESEAIRTRYMRAQELLSQIGAQLLLSSVYVRDALLDPDAGSMPKHRQRLADTYDGLDRALDEYVPVIDSHEERAQIARLQSEIHDFGSTTREVLAGDVARTASDALRVLNTQVVPKRESAIRLSEEVRALNRAALVQQQSSIAEIHRVAERRSWQWLGGALAISLGIGLLALTYSSRLESSLRRQRAVEVQNSRYLQELSAKLITAQEEERRTIARELHDEVGQVLTAIKVELAVAERRLNASGAAGELLADAQVIADSALHSVRDISHLLHPSLLDDLGLAAAVDWYLQAFTKRYAIKTELVPHATGQRLSPEVELAAYRIVQEATTNVARHAGARRCVVTLTADAARLQVVIEDHGKGFDLAAHESGGRRGLGLIGMRERAALLNGTVRVESAPGRGTRVSASLPTDARQDTHG
jgi:signal transduction histidine kinase